MIERRCPKILPPEGYPIPIPKERAWIVWIVNEKSEIVDLEIYDIGFKDDFDPYPKWDKTLYNIRHYLKGRPFRDCGCCQSDWKEWNLADLFFKFGFQYKYDNETTKLYVLNCLGYIDQFENEIENYQKLL